MTDDQKDAMPVDETKQEPEVELTDADMGEVAGGLNPQPLPPGRSRSDT
jgi:hypothetical protein